MNSIPELETRHIYQLEQESGIDRDIIAERGVRSVAGGRELPKEFSWRQKKRGPGILFTVHRPNGETSWSFRPDEVDPDRPGRKYEQPCRQYGGPGNVLDIHPRMRHLIDDVEVEITLVEGLKKGDALTSRGILAVAITGVWNWLTDGKPISDMLDIPVKGRRVNICFDSDMLYNPSVQDAARRLAEHLIERGAEIFITYLHNKPDGSKMGADDFFAAGGTVAQLKMLMRRYEPTDFTEVRLSRDERLQLGLEDLERRFWDFEWKGMGGYSARDVALKLIEAARRHGKPVEDGIRVKKAWGSLELEAKVSRRTLAKAINRLEEWGFLYRDNENRKPDKTGAFVLRANVNHNERDQGTKEHTTHAQQVLHQGGLHLRAPRLRWSRPKFTPRRGVVVGTRKVRKGVKLESRDHIKRLGKIRGAIVDALEASGGKLELENLYGRLHPDRSPEDRNRWRPRDLSRRKHPENDKGRDGPMIMLEEAGILVMDGDVVSLTENWLEALEAQRELGKELEADELAAKRHRLKSRAFHGRGRVRADKAPTEEEMRARREAAPENRREAIRQAIARLFHERPEYRDRRVGQITCALVNYLDPEFPRGSDGVPKDHEVEELLEGVAA
jgi:hypothetical protein